MTFRKAFEYVSAGIMVGLMTKKIQDTCSDVLGVKSKRHSLALESIIGSNDDDEYDEDDDFEE